MPFSIILQVGSIAHEIAHSIGFYHEHSRPDRDDHVTINTDNIRPGFEMDFKKIGARSIEDIEPYDVSSVMHYGPTVSIHLGGGGQIVFNCSKSFINFKSCSQNSSYSF